MCSVLGRRATPMSVHRRLLCVTGSGRSGTQYIHRCLRKIGLRLPLQHERMGADGIVSWYFGGPGPYPPVEAARNPGWPTFERAEQRQDFAFDHFWHQTRHPLKVIPSMQKIHPRTALEYASRVLDEDLLRLPPVVRSAQLWFGWNVRLLHDADVTYRYRIEDIDREWPILMAKLGRNDPLPPVTKTANRSHGFRRAERLVWEELMDVEPLVAAHVRMLTTALGYD